MRSVAVWPAGALVAGAVAGGAVPGPAMHGAVVVLVAAAGWVAWWRHCDRLVLLAVVVGHALGGAHLARLEVMAREHPSLRALLQARVGGFDLDAPVAAGPHAPVLTRLRLTEDAALGESGVRLRGTVEAVGAGGSREAVNGGVLLTVSGAQALEHLTQWRSGRTLEAPVTFRRPARYLTTGAGNAEQDAARSGIALLGRVKSGLAVELVSRGTPLDEWAGAVRAHVRQRVAARMGAGTGPAIVTALLIGDRTAIAADVTERLQAAGTYHVIAISGGNIAVLVLLVTVVFRGLGAGPRVGAGLAIPVLAAYARIVEGGPSVGRAVIMATVYLTATALDVRAPVWNTLAVSAGLLACLHPLEVSTAGYWLTYGATAALIVAGRLALQPGAWSRESGGIGRALHWLLAALGASMMVELAILPVTLTAFSRVTLAGVVANLAAVPAMTVAQVAGLGMALGLPGAAGELSGAVASRATELLLASSSAAELLPWLSPRHPSPAPWVWLIYAGLLAGAWRSRRPWLASAGLCLAVGLWANWPAARPAGDGRLRLMVLDVGQGEAMLLRLPTGESILIDAGGGGSAGAEIGERVVAPALWAQGIRRLDALLITHGDPDHAGGGPVILRDFVPGGLWTGIRVGGHAPTRRLEQSAHAAGVPEVRLTSGDRHRFGEVQVRVLHPPVAGWERPRVRNDDSVVLEVRYREVSLLLTGDAGATIERGILGTLEPARLRVLKVGHHGSRTSTSPELLARWAPHVAVISCGRGNSFGHPAPDVLARLHAAGTPVYRTDRDGEVTIETDGHALTVSTFQEPATKRPRPPS